MGCKMCGDPIPTKNQKYCDNRNCRLTYSRIRSANQVGPQFRDWIFRRDDFACVECGSPEDLQVDHIIPVSEGGLSDPDNLQTLCKPCNMSKGSWNQGAEGHLHRFSKLPITVFVPFIEEFGSIEAAALMSEIIRRPGHLRLGNTFKVEEICERLGISQGRLNECLDVFYEAGVAIIERPEHGFSLLEEGHVRIYLDPWWVTRGKLKPPSNSTRRPNTIRLDGRVEV